MTHPHSTTQRDARDDDHVIVVPPRTPNDYFVTLSGGRRLWISPPLAVEEMPALLDILLREGITDGFPAAARVNVSRHNRRRRLSAPDGLKTSAQAAAKLGISTKTLDGHVKAGALKYVALGHGIRRQRRMFADADLNEFIANQIRKDTPCPSDVIRAPRSGSTDSRSTVVAFSARPRKPTSAKPKR